MVTLTESAIKAVTRFMENSEKDIAGLRIKVDGGGCSGFPQCVLKSIRIAVGGYDWRG